MSRGADYRGAVRRRFGEGLPAHEVAFRIQRAVYEFTATASDRNEPTPFIGITKAGTWPYKVSGCAAGGTVIVQ